MKVAAIIPSLNPDRNLVRVVEELVGAGFGMIYVVNDGSGEEYLPLFQTVAGQPGCEVLRHEENYGKGRALKTAMTRHLETPGDCVGVITLDGDGQHAIEDVVRCGKALEENPDRLVLGVRDFAKEDVPAKSSFGNRVTRTVLRLLFGLPITDTQTGLRGIPNGFAKDLLEVQGDRYEFETNMLLETRRRGVALLEVPIQTIYIDDNAASHFRPFVDSMRIYKLIFKFALSSFASFLVDIALFALLNFLLGFLPAATRLLLATAGARVLSALFNFVVNKTVVFASKEHTGGAMVRYGLLCIAQMLCSYGGTYLLSEVLPFPAVLAKLIVDTCLFFVSFSIQRIWVFPARESKDTGG